MICPIIYPSIETINGRQIPTAADCQESSCAWWSSESSSCVVPALLQRLIPAGTRLVRATKLIGRDEAVKTLEALGLSYKEAIAYLNEPVPDRRRAVIEHVVERIKCQRK